MRSMRSTFARDDAFETRETRAEEEEARAMISRRVDASRGEVAWTSDSVGRSFLDAIRCRSRCRAVSSSRSSSRPSWGTSWRPSVRRACPTARALGAGRRGTTLRHHRHHRSSRSSRSRERWFDGQRLNHFDAGDLRTWSQRYFVNDHRDRESADAAPAVVFLCVSARGPALAVAGDGAANTAPSRRLWRREKEVVFALEHRFYGASQPTGDLSMSSLRYLSCNRRWRTSSRFRPRGRYGLRRVEWSRSGGRIRACWRRGRELSIRTRFTRALASSAPIRAEVDTARVYDVVGGAARGDIGGSDECRDAVREAFERGLNEALKTAEGRRGLERRFNVCGERALDGFGGRDAFGEILRAMFPAQSNDPSCAKDDDSCFNIAKACEAMTSKEDKLDALATYVCGVFRGGRPLEKRRASRALVDDADPRAGERRWTWQTCTEFAFSNVPGRIPVSVQTRSSGDTARVLLGFARNFRN